jgi:hypothetical protein
MEPNYTQVEILLMTGTSFALGNLCKKEDSRRDDNITEKDQLQEACWNGLIQAMLPEICLRSENGDRLYLWNVKEAESFLELELGEIFADMDPHSSITPHLFFSTLAYN